MKRLVQTLGHRIRPTEYGDVGYHAAPQMRNMADFRAVVPVSGYQRPLVHIEEVTGATVRQRTLRAQSAAGTP